MSQYSYTPINRIDEGRAVKWDDKDFILNTQGLYHFHLSMNIESSGLSKRTNDVLLAYVYRNDFHAVGIFDHSIFEPANVDKEMSKESERMWELHDKHSSVGMKPDTVYIDHPITTSGHPLHIVHMSSYYAQLILNVDSRLDDRDYVNKLYALTPLDPSQKFSFEWCVGNQ